MQNDDSKLATLGEFDFITDANILKGMLMSNGIPAMITEEYNPYGTTFSRSKVLVFERDLEMAKRLMNDCSESADLDSMAENADDAE